MVVLPAQLGSVSADTYTLAAEKATAKARFDVAAAPGIDAPEMVDREENVGPVARHSRRKNAGNNPNRSRVV